MQDGTQNYQKRGDQQKDDREVHHNRVQSVPGWEKMEHNEILSTLRAPEPTFRAAPFIGT
jgi:hypothetical protein